MKRIIFLLLPLILLLSSCSMEATIPENSRTFSYYLENKELFRNCISYLETLDHDAMVSRNEYFPVEGSEEIEGIFMQNMSDQSVSVCDSEAVLSLFENTDVKLIDLIRRDDLVICSFDMCIPGKNFDYGIYYSSGNQEIYFGDPSLALMESGNGFSYEKKAAYGTKFTYYTEKIEDHFFYYEIA